MKSIQDFFQILEQPKKVVITTHYKPDADAIGSSLALYHYLRKFNHDVTVISPSEVPDFLKWMTGIETVLDYELQKQEADKIIDESDYIFCLDFNHPSRVRTLEPKLVSATAPKIIIDHHLEPLSEFFAFGISLPSKSSTCEMIYDFIVAHNGTDKLDAPIMECIYAGCMTDTGSFRFPVTTASVHEMIAEFKHRGLNHSRIHQEIYDNYNANRLKLLGHILNTIYLNETEHFAIMYLSLADAQKFDVKSGDTEGIVNYGLSVKTIDVVFFLTERASGEVRISMRSKGNVDVSQFSRSYFNGGGHFNASGGVSYESLDATIAKIKQLVVETNLVNK